MIPTPMSVEKESKARIKGDLSRVRNEARGPEDQRISPSSNTPWN